MHSTISTCDCALYSVRVINQDNEHNINYHQSKRIHVQCNAKHNINYHHRLKRIQNVSAMQGETNV